MIIEVAEGFTDKSFSEIVIAKVKVVSRWATTKRREQTDYKNHWYKRYG